MKLFRTCVMFEERPYGPYRRNTEILTYGNPTGHLPSPTALFTPPLDPPKNSTTYSGYSCSAFPGCHSGAPLSIAIPAPDGSHNVPEAFVGQFMPNHFNEWIHMLHRFFAIFGGTWLMFMAWQLRTSSPLSGIRHVGTAILLLIPSEVLVGIVNALYRIPVPVSALHTAIAATLVGLIAYALSESALLSKESESASTEQITACSARSGVIA